MKKLLASLGIAALMVTFGLHNTIRTVNAGATPGVPSFVLTDTFNATDYNTVEYTDNIGIPYTRLVQVNTFGITLGGFNWINNYTTPDPTYGSYQAKGTGSYPFAAQPAATISGTSLFGHLPTHYAVDSHTGNLICEDDNNVYPPAAYKYDNTTGLSTSYLTGPYALTFATTSGFYHFFVAIRSDGTAMYGVGQNYCGTEVAMSPIPGGLTNGRQPSIALVSSNNEGTGVHNIVRFFIVGTDNNVWSDTYDASVTNHWSGWSIVGGQVVGGVSAVSVTRGSSTNTKMDVFVDGTDNKIYYKESGDGGYTWSSWQLLDGQITGGPSCGELNQAKPGTVATQYILCVVTGTDGKLYARAWLGPNSPSWTAYTNIGSPV